MKMLLLLLLSLLLMKSMDAYMMTNSMTSMIQYMQLKSIKINNNNMKKKIKISNNDDNNSNNDNNNSNSNNDNSKIEGYLGSDLSKLDNDKQSRVLLYIGIALLPCLFLIPFVMSRDFVPPTDDTSPFGF